MRLFIGTSCFIFIMYIHFIWDESKADGNRRKHGVSFADASSAFHDPAALVIHDPDHSAEEERYVLLGHDWKLRLLVVCHCYREPESVIRIISARKATKAEFRRYGGAHES